MAKILKDTQKTEKEKVILVALQLDESPRHFAYSLEEMKNLIQTAGGEVVYTLTQKLEKPCGKTFVGKGKLEELKQVCLEQEADLVVTYQALSPSQIRTLSDELSIKVVDRVQLILDIFAARAKSSEGKLQVKLAQLQYLLPRLIGQGTELSRLGGGIGTRGPGESKLETDKRHIQAQMDKIKEDLQELEKHRHLLREQRSQSPSFQFGLIGYTNAGKSTLQNALTDANTFAKDLLFATLDPLTRKIESQQAFDITLTDTVGFIQKLPTTLIHAFKSTLEESKCVNLLLHVVDASQPEYELHEKVVLELLEELDMLSIPRITLYNKIDQKTENFHSNAERSFCLSALCKEDIARLKVYLLDEMKKEMQKQSLFLPLSAYDLFRREEKHLFVEKMDYQEEKNAYELVFYHKKDYQVAFMKKLPKENVL